MRRISKFKIQNSKFTGGFTLIELLIVVAIIGVLATLLMANFVGIRQRARDVQRKSEIQQIRSALELYRADQGAYPINATDLYTGGVCNATFSSGSTVYMKKVPCDPLGNGMTFYGGYYLYSSDGSQYTLQACLENANDNDTNDTATPALPGLGACASSKYFTLTNP